MITPKTLPALVVGLVTGFCLVIACGDDGGSPIDAADAADAAACDCPAAEPPIPGRIVVRETPTVIEPGSTLPHTGGCNAGEELIGGGCRTVEVDPEIVLGSSYRTETGAWWCTWTSTSPVAADAAVQAFCLVPP